jgi:hypothetical protein
MLLADHRQELLRASGSAGNLKQGVDGIRVKLAKSLLGQPGQLLLVHLPGILLPDGSQLVYIHIPFTGM